MAAVAATRIWTRGMWEERALELAEAAHLDGTARLLADNELHAVYSVRRDSASGEYLVHVEQLRGEIHRIRCSCVGGQFSRPCKHAGSVIYALRQREQAMSQPDTDPLASWRRGGEW